MPGFRCPPSPFDPNLRKHVADQAFQLESGASDPQSSLVAHRVYLRFRQLRAAVRPGWSRARRYPGAMFDVHLPGVPKRPGWWSPIACR